jgi:hypothetical protein
MTAVPPGRPSGPISKHSLALLICELTGQSVPHVEANLTDADVAGFSLSISNILHPEQVFTPEALGASVLANPEQFTVDEMLAYVASITPGEAYPGTAGTAKLVTWAATHMAAIDSYQDGSDALAAWALANGYVASPG